MLFARSIAIVVFLVFAAPASAATVNVTSLADSGPGTLRAAIAAAPQGDATTIVLPAGTITLASKLTIANRSLTITGQGAPATAISGGGVTRLIDVTDDSPLLLSTLTLRDGADDTVSVLNAQGGAKLTLDRVDLRANTSAQGADGNGAIALKGGSLSMNSSQVVGNVAGGTGHKVTGGIVKAQDADVDVSGVLFDANAAGGGGGAGAAVGALFALTDGAAPNSTLNMTQVTATGNHGGGGGGTAAGDGLVDASGYDVAATRSTFTGNVLGGGDGTAAGFGIFTATAGASRSATVSLDGVTVSGNAIGVGPAGGTGGAVSVSSSADSAVLGVSVTRSLISDNDVGGQGGVGFGGAINAAATGASDKLAVTVAQSTIAGNRVGVGTGGVGGAVAISGSGSGTTSALHTTVSTISGNTAGSSAAHDGYGGGLETGPSSSLDVAETTIAGNRVTGPKGHGGGIYAAGGTIAKSIVAANTAADHGNCLASLTSGGHNLESANSCGLQRGRRPHRHRPRARAAGQLRRVASGAGVAPGKRGRQCRRRLSRRDRRARHRAPAGRGVRHRRSRGRASVAHDTSADEPRGVERDTDRNAREARRPRDHDVRDRRHARLRHVAPRARDRDPRPTGADHADAAVVGRRPDQKPRSPHDLPRPPRRNDRRRHRQRQRRRVHRARADRDGPQLQGHAVDVPPARRRTLGKPQTPARPGRHPLPIPRVGHRRRRRPRSPTAPAAGARASRA